MKLLDSSKSKTLSIILTIICLVMWFSNNAHSDICDPSDVATILDTEKTKEAYKNCKIKPIAEAYTLSCKKLLEALELLENFYKEFAPSYAASQQDQEATNATYATDMNGAQNVISEIETLDWEGENVETSFRAKERKLYEYSQRLVGEISGQDVSLVKQTYKIAFCAAMLEWDRVQLWQRKFRQCQENY